MIDNAVIVMDAEAFWVQMNYQVIHLLDFLPAASWKVRLWRKGGVKRHPAYSVQCEKVVLRDIRLTRVQCDKVVLRDIRRTR